MVRQYSLPRQRDRRDMSNNLPNRQSIRLKNYDYSQSGLYFVTICTKNRECLFGDIVGAIHESPVPFGDIVGANHDSPIPKMVLNDIGKIIDSVWKSLLERFPIILDKFQIMPNHVHMIINIVGAHHDAPDLNNDAPDLNNDTPDLNHDAPVYKRAIHESPLQKLSVRKRSLLSQIIGYFKMNSAKSIHQINPNIPVWQRNYYEHIIRTENDLNKIREYISNNPTMWDRDRNNPKKS